MRTDTQTITISSPVKDVHSYVADPENLPRWAIRFAKSVAAQEDGRWLVESTAGPVMMRVDADAQHGTVDFVMEPEPGVEAVAHSRVVANGDGAEFIFTQFQPPGMPDEAFARQVESVQHEFAALKALLEVDRTP